LRPHNTKQGVGTGPHAQPVGQPRSGFAFQVRADPALNVGQPPRSATITRHDIVDGLSENLPPAPTVNTPQAPHPQLNTDQSPLPGQICKPLL